MCINLRAPKDRPIWKRTWYDLIGTKQYFTIFSRDIWRKRRFMSSMSPKPISHETFFVWLDDKTSMNKKKLVYKKRRETVNSSINIFLDVSTLNHQNRFKNFWVKKQTKKLF